MGYFLATEEGKHTDMLVISIHPGSSDYSSRSEFVLLGSINITCWETWAAVKELPCMTSGGSSWSKYFSYTRKTRLVEALS